MAKSRYKKQRYSEKDYHRLLKEIRPYISFDYDLRHKLKKHEKAKIRLYHDKIGALLNRPHQIYRARNKKNLKTAQRYAQHDERLTQMKVAIIPIAGDKKVRVRFNPKGEITVTGEYATTDIIYIDYTKAAIDPINTVNEAIKYSTADKFKIVCGEFEDYDHTHEKETIALYYAEMISRYGDNGTMLDEKEYNHASKWLFGIKEYRFRNQVSVEDWDEYQRKKGATIRKAKQKRRNEFLATKRLKQSIKDYNAVPNAKDYKSIVTRAKKYNVEHLIPKKKH